MFCYRITDHPSAADAALGILRCDPVWARDITAPRYFELIHETWTLGDRPMTPAEVGCALAHIAVLERIAASGRHGLILEADMPVTTAQLAQVRAVLDRQPDVEFVNMQGETRLPMRGWPRPDGLYLADCDWDFSGAAAYLVSPGFAARLVAFQRKRLRRADDWRDVFAQDPAPPLYLPVFGGMGPGSTIDAERRMLRHSRLLPLILRRLGQRLQRDKRRLMRVLRLVPPVLPKAPKLSNLG